MDMRQNETDILLREYDSSGECGNWIGKWEYQTIEGDTYTVCQDQDGEEWIED